MQKHTVIAFLLMPLFFAAVVAFPSVAKADMIGDSQSFYIDSEYDALGRGRVPATLRLISNRAYVYVDDGAWLTLSPSGRDYYLSFLQGIGDQFDTIVYPRETQMFGSEPNPGIDGDQRITIFINQMKTGVGGYFSDANELTQDEMGNSNQREMLYIGFGVTDSRQFLTFLSHEFNHLLTYNQKTKSLGIIEDTWLNELRAEYGVTVAGYNDPFWGSSLDRRLQSYLGTPTDSLTNWDEVQGDYGQVALFGQYLAEQFSPQFIAKTAHVRSSGIDSINEELATIGRAERRAGVFGNWITANFLNDASIDSRLGYSGSLQNFHVPPQLVVSTVGDASPQITGLALYPWQGSWIEYNNISGNKPILDFSFSSEDLNHLRVAYLVWDQSGKVTYHQQAITAADPHVRINLGMQNPLRIVLMPYRAIPRQGNIDAQPAVSLFVLAQRLEASHITVPPILEALGLTEGDFIRARGDNDIYVINNFGYKRLILTPGICLMYGHLQSRGCFDATKEVSPEVRDAFITSWYATDGENHDGIVYRLDQTGDDAGRLVVVASTPKLFSQDDFEKKVFLINTSEKNFFLH